MKTARKVLIILLPVGVMAAALALSELPQPGCTKREDGCKRPSQKQVTPSMIDGQLE